MHAETLRDSPGTTLLVASQGGHFEELQRLIPRILQPGRRYIWMTHPSPQTLTSLATHDAVFVREVAQRDFLGVVRTWPKAREILASANVTSVVSTGAAVALGVLPLAAARGLPTYYIESAARVTDVALTGRLLARVPGVTCYHQHGIRRRGWHTGGSVFDGFIPGAERRAPIRIGRVVVTVGSQYGFRRLIQRLAEILPDDVEVLWQTGKTDLSGLNIDGVQLLPAEVMRQAIADADVVVAHAGVGAALAAFDNGRTPVLAPRKATHGEHIDDHQAELASLLCRRRLAVTAGADELDWEHLVRAAARPVERTAAQPFVLTPDPER